MQTRFASRTQLRHCPLCFLPWIATLSIIVSLLGPIETFAAPPPDEPPIHATQCPDGTLWNNQTQQCDPLPDIPVVDPNDDQDPACGEGEVPNGNGGCIPDQQPTCPDGQVLDHTGNCQPLPPPPCPEGTVRDGNGNCIAAQQPEPPDCKEGQILDEDWACVPDPDVQPTCKDGEIYDQDIPGCVPDPDVQPDCKDGQVYDEDVPGCVPIEKESGGNSVTITYHRCPDGLGAETVFTTLLELCPVIEGVRFTGTFGERIEKAITDSDGRAMFDGLPPGNWAIEPVDRDTEPGTIQMLAGCNIHIGPEAQNPLMFENVQRITGDFGRPDGITWDCHWVDIVLELPQVTITKYACPEGTDPDAFMVDLLAVCTVAEGVEFLAQDDGGPHFPGGGWLVPAKATDRNGKVSWRAPDEIRNDFMVEELVPDAYGMPTIFCRYVGVAPDSTLFEEWTHVYWGLTRYTATVSGIYIGSEATAFECNWFNLHAADQGITFVLEKRTCLPTPAPTPFPSSPAPTPTVFEVEFSRCAIAAGVEFRLITGGTLITTITDSGGFVAWGEVPSGAWKLEEAVPEGYGEPEVRCRWKWPFRGSGLTDHLEPQFVDGGTVSGVFTDDQRGMVWWCLWLNIPLDPAPTGTPPPSSTRPPGNSFAVLTRFTPSWRTVRRDGVTTLIPRRAS